MNTLKKIREFLKKDSWGSLLIWLIIIAVFILYIFFPFLSWITQAPLPLVIVESCSMYHETSFDKWWDKHYSWYIGQGFIKTEFEEFPLLNGLNKGDIIVVWGRSQYEIGDIIIFQTNSEHNINKPVIHRIVKDNPISTKGDNGFTNQVQAPFERNIEPDQILGKAVAKIPFIGWIKLILFEPFQPSSNKGTCYNQIKEKIQNINDSFNWTN
jgi:signal peptidase I